MASRVAFILSAKAGPQKATTAPNVSVASMVLVFDIVFSLAGGVDTVLKPRNFAFIPALP